MTVFLCAICSVLAAYLIGSFSTAVWVGKQFFGKDVREYGSKNAGTTNVIRVLGWKPGIVVFLIDVLKGGVALLLTSWICGEEILNELQILPVLSAIAVVLGHVFPLYFGFHGGKGVATLLGVGLALYPLATLSALGVFVVVLLLTNYVSAGSMTAGIAFPFFVYFLFPEGNICLRILAIAVAIFMPVVHLKNIKRILKGEENKLFKK